MNKIFLSMVAIIAAAFAGLALILTFGNRSAVSQSGNAVILLCQNPSGSGYTVCNGTTPFQVDESLTSQFHTDLSGAIPAGTNFIGNVALNAVASGGWTYKWLVAANSDNATNLKNTAGIVHAVEVYGIGSAPAYLKFYDTSTTPTCGSSTIVKQIMIPAASTAANGSGANIAVLDTQFSTGISYCVVTGIAATDDTSVAAATFVVNIDYK